MEFRMDFDLAIAVVMMIVGVIFIFKPEAAAIPRITTPVNNERVAPQKISPAMTSSTFNGVATIASKVFWYSIRTKVP